MRIKYFVTALISCALLALPVASASAQMGPKAPKGAWVYFSAPANGATVKSPVKFVMGVKGAQIKPAGENMPGTGHFHLIVDDVPVPHGVVVPADATHVHFGKGQTEAALELSPGLHTITLQFADYLHQSYGPQLTQTIIVKVE